MDGSVYRVSLFRILFKPDLKGRLKLWGRKIGKGKKEKRPCKFEKKNGSQRWFCKRYFIYSSNLKESFLYVEEKSFEKFSNFFLRYIIFCCQFSYNNATEQ